MSELNTCGGCATRWSGTVEAHCSACHESFSTPENFDKHHPRRTAAGKVACGIPATMTRTKTDGTVVPVFKATQRAGRVVWIGWYPEGSNVFQETEGVSE